MHAFRVPGLDRSTPGPRSGTRLLGSQFAGLQATDRPWQQSYVLFQQVEKSYNTLAASDVWCVRVMKYCDKPDGLLQPVENISNGMPSFTAP